MRRLMFAMFIVVGAVLFGVNHADWLATRASQESAVWLPYVSALPTPTPTLIPATVRVAPACCQFDAPGDDNENVAEEYVCLQNQGQMAAVMDGWQVRDAADRVYVLGAFTLGPGQNVKLHTGAGVNTATDLYWGLARAVWNNDGDTVYVYDAAGILVDQYTYGLK